VFGNSEIKVTIWQTTREAEKVTIGAAINFIELSSPMLDI
jgi:hypothetical protein